MTQREMDLMLQEANAQIQKEYIEGILFVARRTLVFSLRLGARTMFDSVRNFHSPCDPLAVAASDFFRTAAG